MSAMNWTIFDEVRTSKNSFILLQLLMKLTHKSFDCLILAA